MPPEAAQHPSALVTGAAGYIGRVLCEELLARGYVVRAAVRAGGVVASGAQAVVFDLEEVVAGGPERALFEGVHTVFHLAGIAHRGASAAAMRRLNCDAALAMAEAANAAGVEHFVYVSSLYAGLGDGDGERDAGGYARSKLLAEQALLAAERRWRMRLTIVRPALVYGGAVKGRLATLLSLARRGWLPALPALGNTPMVGRPDLVRALVLLGFHPSISGNVFAVTDAERYPLERIARALREAAGRGPAAWRVPACAFGALLWLAMRLERMPLVGKRVAVPRGLRDWDVGPDPRLAALGWAPAATLESALAAAAGART